MDSTERPIVETRQTRPEDGKTVVRAAVEADAAAIAAIGQVAVPETFKAIISDPAVVGSIVAQSYGIDALRACIGGCRNAEDAHFLVAERGGRVVGFVHYDCEGEEPELHRIYLDSTLKRRGIGSALLAELHRRLPPGSSYVLMVVAANLPAVAFYERHGLTEAAKVDGVAHNAERMGIEFPAGTAPVPGLILRYTKPPNPRERIRPVTQFMVERHLAGFPPEQLPAAAAAAKQTAIEVSDEGRHVRYLRSTYVPEGERCYCLFEGISHDAVAEVQKRANLPYETIHEAAFLTAEDV